MLIHVCEKCGHSQVLNDIDYISKAIDKDEETVQEIIDAVTERLVNRFPKKSQGENSENVSDSSDGDGAGEAGDSPGEGRRFLWAVRNDPDDPGNYILEDVNDVKPVTFINYIVPGAVKYELTFPVPIFESRSDCIDLLDNDLFDLPEEGKTGKFISIRDIVRLYAPDLLLSIHPSWVDEYGWRAGKILEFGYPIFLDGAFNDDKIKACYTDLTDFKNQVVDENFYWFPHFKTPTKGGK